MTSLTGPQHAFGVRTDEAYEARQRQQVKPRPGEDPVAAYVNHGRWLADCACGSGLLVSPEWGVGRCFECGRVYRTADKTLVLPGAAKRAGIEAALDARGSAGNRNWLPRESVAQLRRENKAHKVGG